MPQMETGFFLDTIFCTDILFGSLQATWHAINVKNEIQNVEKSNNI